MTEEPENVLVVYRPSARADLELREVARRVAQRGGRLTVAALALKEATGKGCCDTRSVLWNRFTTEFAQEDLARARLALDDPDDVEFAVVTHNGRRVADAIVEAGRLRGADEIVVADANSSALSRRERRRLLAGGAAYSAASI